MGTNYGIDRDADVVLRRWAESMFSWTGGEIWN